MTSVYCKVEMILFLKLIIRFFGETVVLLTFVVESWITLTDRISRFDSVTQQVATKYLN